MTVLSDHPPLTIISNGQKREFRRETRRKQLISHMLVLPLLVFIAILFVGPILGMLSRSVENTELVAGLPTVARAIDDWDETGLPAETTYLALAKDLANPGLRPERAGAARRLNYELPGYRTLLLGTARKIDRIQDQIDANAKQALIQLDPRWGDPAYWHAIKRASTKMTPYYLLAAIDLKVNDDGLVVRADPEQRIFIDILLRSLWVGTVVTIICLLLAFPVANFMVAAGPRLRALVLLSILLPFWTSLLVRTTAWIVVLQREGLVNDILTSLSVVQDPLELVFNRFGVYVAMVHILLPFMVLPLYSVMQGIPPSFMRAAASLGAPPLQAFFKVYLPMTLPGVGAGCLLTFIIAVGYYITPALVGGAQDQMIGYFIAFFTNMRLNWGMASALSFILLICIMALYVGLGRFIGIGRLVGVDK